MPCARMTNDDGKTVGFLCYDGPYTHLVRARCPWCCLGNARTVHATRLVHSGWAAPDMICGRCGQYWSHDDGYGRMSEGERSENLAIVREMKRGGLRAGRFPVPTDL